MVAATLPREQGGSCPLCGRSGAPTGVRLPFATVFVRVRDGETITASERRAVVILAHREDLTLTWSRYAPGEQGPGPHVHREHTDAFYVLEGELTFGVGTGGAERIPLGAGGFVAVPPNVTHTFANEGRAEARWLNLHAPDKGFAGFLRNARDGLDAGFDSFDPPADGGLPATEATVSQPGEGERRESGGHVALVKCVLPELRVAEWVLDGPGPHDRDPAGTCFVLDGEDDAPARVLEIVAPGVPLR